MIIAVKNKTKKDEEVRRIETAVKLVYHPITVPKPRRKEFLRGMLAATGLLNKSDTPLMTVRQLAGWLYASCRLCKTADSQQGIAEESIETELYNLMQEKA